MHTNFPQTTARFQLEFLQHYFVREDGHLGFWLDGREHTIHLAPDQQLPAAHFPIAVYEPAGRRLLLHRAERNQDGDYPLFSREQFFQLLRTEPEKVGFDAYDRRGRGAGADMAKFM